LIDRSFAFLSAKTSNTIDADVDRTGGSGHYCAERVPGSATMTEANKKSYGLSRLGRWAAELVLVFVSVYAAFWLNNYQQHRQDAERRDRILASIEQTLREGIESGKINRAKEQHKAPNLGERFKPGRLRPLLR